LSWYTQALAFIELQVDINIQGFYILLAAEAYDRLLLAVHHFVRNWLL
jgi:hypothetical protein